MTKIALNFFEIQLSKDQINIPFLTFGNKEDLDDLRKNMKDSLFIHSKDKIYFCGDNHLTSNTLDEINIYHNRDLFLKIFAESLLKQFYQDKTKFKCRKKFHTYKITFLDQDFSNDQFKGLSFYKTFHVHFTHFIIDSKTVLGVTISMSISEKITWTIDDFKREKIKYEDLKFDEQSGKILINSESKYRLAHHFKYESELKKEVDFLNELQNEFYDINQFVTNYFEKKTFILPDNLEILKFNKIAFNLGLKESSFRKEGNLKSDIFNVPECYFYRGKHHSSSINRIKIKYNKPFSFDEFENRIINISLIYPKNFYSDVVNFFKHILNELLDIFKIKKENFRYTTFEINNFDLSSYQKELASVSRAKPDLVLVVIDESHEALETADSPYFFCKSKFIEQGINTQEIQIQQIQKFLSDKKNTSKHNYTHHNMALNIYAKLGGMAWTIKPKEAKNELVIGIGATVDKNSQPVLGLASVFRGDGKYLFGQVSSVTNMKNYQDRLEQIILTTIQNSIEDGTLDTSKTFSLIFHIFKPAGKDNEIKALEQVIKKLNNYSFEYAFVHIGDGHNYRFFTYDYENKLPAGILEENIEQNEKGTFIEINNRYGFLGLKPNNSSFFKIEIHKKSNFIDLEYIAKQIYQFAEMSHTSYNKSSIPVTIKYPNLMAYFAEKLKEINGFYLDEISMPDNSLWFI